MKVLTTEEKGVNENKRTEAPFSGKYWNFYEKGKYMCMKCGAQLFSSDSKFDAHCGWPSFDEALPGAVKESIDSDGVRAEISCSNCEAHLGHVFKGEGFTESNTRHCVNSTALKFRK